MGLHGFNRARTFSPAHPQRAKRRLFPSEHRLMTDLLIDSHGWHGKRAHSIAIFFCFPDGVLRLGSCCAHAAKEIPPSSLIRSPRNVAHDWFHCARGGSTSLNFPIRSVPRAHSVSKEPTWAAFNHSCVRVARARETNGTPHPLSRRSCLPRQDMRKTLTIGLKGNRTWSHILL